MISRNPPTPPMSETNVLGVASSVFEISNLAAKVSVRLFSLSRKLKDAIKPVEALSKDVASTGAVLNQLGHQLKKGEDVQVGSSTLVTSVDDLVEECSNIFDSIDKALDGDNTGSKAILGLQHYVHFASLEPQLVLLERNLERLKTPLALMLNVLIYAEQLKSQEQNHVLQEQQELIKVLNEERKANERRFHKLTAENESELGGAGAPKLLRKELPSLPTSPNLEAIDEEPRPRGRVWIKEESPEREEQPAQDPPPTSRTSSTPRQVFVKVRSMSAPRQVAAKFRGRGRAPQPVHNAEDEDPSLLDMASFLRSTGPGTSRIPGEDSFSLPVVSNRSRSRFEPREATVRSDSSDLINFFREGSPRMAKNSAVKKPPSATPLRRSTDPITPPLTGNEEAEKTSVLSHASAVQKARPPPASLVQKSPTPQSSPAEKSSASATSTGHNHTRSLSAELPSPLGSHPPKQEINTPQPATTKWPLQTVLAWLNKNSFSAEWQETFRVLQIEGSEFVELESGQSIRKMLTVIYPQVAKECSESGKGWEQARERAEGQRLRKLIRELPVDTKYDDGHSKAPEQTARDGLARRSSAKLIEITSGGRRRATASSNEDTSSRSAQAHPVAEFRHTEITALPEAEVEQEPNFDLTPDVEKKEVDDQQRHRRGESDTSSNVPDEWVRKWTLLSSEEIARGREVPR